jgi:hypothetical protein
MRGGAWRSRDLLELGLQTKIVSRLEHAVLKVAQRLLRLEFDGERDIKVMFMMRGVVLPTGSMLAPHRHDGADGAHYSGVWYLDAGDSPEDVDRWG